MVPGWSLEFWNPRSFSALAKVPAVSKRGVDDGNQKVGAFSSRQKKAANIITPFSIYLRRVEAERRLKFFKLT
jgi:hypothetical protein